MQLSLISAESPVGRRAEKTMQSNEYSWCDMSRAHYITRFSPADVMIPPLASPLMVRLVISCLLCTSCCITSRQLHNSPIYTPSFAWGLIHTFSHVALLAQNKQSWQTVAEISVWFMLCSMTSDLRILSKEVAEAEWKQWQCHEPPGSCLRCSCKVHINEPDRVGGGGVDGRGDLSVESSTSHLFAPQAPCMCLSSAVCVGVFCCRGPSLQVWPRLLRSSSHPEAGAGHPSVPEERQPGRTLHLTFFFCLDQIFIQTLKKAIYTDNQQYIKT